MVAVKRDEYFAFAAAVVQTFRFRAHHLLLYVCIVRVYVYAGCAN